MEELESLKKEVALAKHNALAAISSSDSDNRAGDQGSQVRKLESKLNNLESKVIGGYGLESRLDDLETKVSDLLSHSH
jgi:hypothetical protein